MGVAEDKQLLKAASDGYNTSEVRRLIEQKVANVNCTNKVRRSGEESTARALRVGRQGEEAAEAYSIACREAEEEERPHATSVGLACGRGTASLPSRPSCRPGS